VLEVVVGGEAGAEVGERDPSKIAKSALGMIREYEQIMRSKPASLLQVFTPRQDERL